MTRWESTVTQQTLKQSFPKELELPCRVKFQTASFTLLKLAAKITMVTNHPTRKSLSGFTHPFSSTSLGHSLCLPQVGGSDFSFALPGSQSFVRIILSPAKLHNHHCQAPSDLVAQFFPQRFFFIWMGFIPSEIMSTVTIFYLSSTLEKIICMDAAVSAK